MFRLLALLVLLSSCASMSNKYNSKEVSYSADGVEMKGYLVKPKNIKPNTPALLVVHEWWGHNEYARQRAEMLADLGYVALAVDMYGDAKTASHPKDAMKFSSAVMKNVDGAKKRFVAAMNILKNDKDVDPKRIGAIGYCFGGGVVLNMARADIGLWAVASFHGSLGAAIKAKGQLMTDVIVFNGADDPMVSKKDIAGFKKEMKKHKAHYHFVNYPNTVHAFTNPNATELGKKFNLPLAYNAYADKDSWKKMQAFFNEGLK